MRRVAYIIPKWFPWLCQEWQRWSSPLIFTLLVGLLALFASPLHASSPVGTIEKGSGANYYMSKKGKQWSVVKKGQSLFKGDRVKTGTDGRMEIGMEDGSRLTLGNETELEITQFLVGRHKRKGRIALVKGKLRTSITRFSGRTDIRVKTPTGVAGVKGTEFMVMNQGKANIFFGTEGQTGVMGNKGEEVSLRPDTMTENTRGHAPIEPVGIEPGTPLAHARDHLAAVTDVDAPVEWKEAGNLPIILARWNIKYGHYLADSGRYEDALEVFQIAADLTERAEVKAEAHLERGTVYSRNMGLMKKAMDEYLTVIRDYPKLPHVENALYSAGMISMETGDKRQAKSLFERYLREYPSGMHASTIKLLLEELDGRGE
ncbi:MAG: FecR domain-containing protein [Thermodesulfobacteriota bacterium]